MTSGLHYLHNGARELRIVHRDIKSMNILITSTEHFDNLFAKISDFGTTKTIEETNELMSERGTYNWMAPELIRGDPVSEKCDIYSFAMVLYEMLAKKIPYREVG